MDAMTLTLPQDKQPAYTTPKRVQAWFLGRSRDRWKKKYASLKAQCKRLRQRVADVCASRAKWRNEAEAARHEAQELRNQIAALQAELGTRADEAEKKTAALAGSLTTRRSRRLPPTTATAAV